jgi:hypothetical protein
MFRRYSRASSLAGCDDGYSDSGGDRQEHHRSAAEGYDGATVWAETGSSSVTESTTRQRESSSPGGDAEAFRVENDGSNNDGMIGGRHPTARMSKTLFPATNSGISDDPRGPCRHPPPRTSVTSAARPAHGQQQRLRPPARPPPPLPPTHTHTQLEGMPCKEHG